MGVGSQIPNTKKPSERANQGRGHWVPAASDSTSTQGWPKCTAGCPTAPQKGSHYKFLLRSRVIAPVHEACIANTRSLYHGLTTSCSAGGFPEFVCSKKLRLLSVSLIYYAGARSIQPRHAVTVQFSNADVRGASTLWKPSDRMWTQQSRRCCLGAGLTLGPQN